MFLFVVLVFGKQQCRIFSNQTISHTGLYALRAMLNILVVDYMHVYIELHALLANNFEHRVLRIEPIINAPCTQRCADRSTEFTCQKIFSGYSHLLCMLCGSTRRGFFNSVIEQTNEFLVKSKPNNLKD